MRAWTVAARGRLELVDLPDPEPADDELLVRVLACGVCRTDLHVLDHDLPPHRPRVVPGHEAVGEVLHAPAGSGVGRGDLVGVAWLRRTCGECADCRAGRENLCRRSQYTGWDADGGYAELLTVPAAYAYPWPTGLDPVEGAPLLCAGIIGYRALRRSALPDGGVLGLYGFGGSAHLTAQAALAAGARVHVMTRSPDARALALVLGCHSAQGPADPPPEPLDSAILFAPAGELVLPALEALRPGGTLAVAGIHLSDIPPLDYQRHLFHEKQLVSVEANTREDGRDLLALAGRIGMRATVDRRPFEAADLALADLRADRVTGAAVLVMA
ncbi:zinc-binding alcohol dehydrogenase family protein [Actinotalea fermentans]|uniref:Probable alcohol dehydrogenase AdhA n=1 Tax=Actinotalea fermentans TaxID=43671 RepID=A0A511YX26_9CELL|nr:zinc-binding alcohol dehydrogenase family protein [Actinotalea fermentans]KGM15636.1 alcohol dehydrogenase [Actinotalea fermentans ATCC 43279 = JCM 9966 = DSM 3133]GEN79763.1 alcohol dehydrogenase [Actinotalea fermentans]